MLQAAGPVLLHDEVQFSSAAIRSLLYNMCARISPTTCNYLYQLFGGPADSNTVSGSDTGTGPGPGPGQEHFHLRGPSAAVRLIELWANFKWP